MLPNPPWPVDGLRPNPTYALGVPTGRERNMLIITSTYDFKAFLLLAELTIA
jgi:hypothetical protein